jgi:adenylate cyclase class 2
MSLEIECKIHLPGLEFIAPRLQSANAQVVRPRLYENNTRYENPAGDFTPRDIVLRLRQDDRARLTFKRPVENALKTAGSSTRLELETIVEDFAVMDAILRELDFRPFMIYEKYRTTYHLPEVGEAELMLDEMPFGLFLEVEGTPTAIDHALQRLGLADMPRIIASYAELFEMVRARYHLTFTDLTFQNFAGLTIEPQVFEAAYQR